MRFDKKWYCSIKKRRIYRRKTSQSNLNNLWETQNYLRFDYDLVKIIRKVNAIAIDIISDRVCKIRFRFERIRIKDDRLSDFIAGIYGEWTSRINKWVNKRVNDRRVNKWINKNINKIEQENSHLNEVQRWELRQKAKINSYDKTGKKHQSRWWKWISNNARNHQSFHVREVMRESNSRWI